MWTAGINIHEVKEIRTRTNLYFGVGAITKIDPIVEALKKKGIHSVLIVSGKGAYIRTGAWDHVKAALDKHSMKFALYDGATPNPTAEQVDAAAELGRMIQAGAVIAIGGGSPVDTGKSAAILLRYPGKTARDVYEFRFSPEEAVPIVAINLTHGTGTETNRFAVVTIPEKEFKPAIACDCIYPTWAIDDPALMTGLSPAQTRYVSIDAVNHVVEAATAKTANPMSIMLAAETIRLIVDYLPLAEKDPKNLEARYFLLYASMIAGMSFDNGLLHFTHALEHPLSALKPDFTHGLGLSILLPAVVEKIYPVRAKVLADILSPIDSSLKGTPDEAYKAACSVEAWLEKSGVPEKLADEGFRESDIEKLVQLTFHTPSLSGLLSLAPEEATEDCVRWIYQNSFHPIRQRPK